MICTKNLTVKNLKNRYANSLKRVLNWVIWSSSLQFDEGLVKDEESSHYRRYLLIIGILVLSFSLSFMIRIQPLDYGFELAEFDPYFNYRATQFLVENGLPA